jgi:hypothetical protein
MRISKNVYFVGKENFPYLGLGGEVFSGLTVAQQILKRDARTRSATLAFIC